MHSKLTSALLLTAVSLLGALTAHGQFQPPADGQFEEPPTLEAASILRPEFVSGPHFSVRPEVPTYSGRNQYQIDSDFGNFEADGNAELLERVQEIAAIARLREISLTEEYKKGLAKAAESPLLLAKGLIRHPSKTISGVPKGIWKFMNRAGQTLKEAGEERERSPYEDGAGKDLIGFSKAKRAIALQLHVDPYSSNEVLQKELNAVSWTAYAGSMTVNLALAPVGGGAGAAISGLNIANTAEAALRDTSPSDLRRASLGQLLDMGIAREEAIALLNNNAYSPTNQTLLVEALQRLEKVGGRDSYLRLATDASEKTDATFFRRTAQLIAALHRESPLNTLAVRHGLPICLARDGTAIIALDWDYAARTPTAAQFLATLKAENAGNENVSGYRVVLSGVASPLVKEHLAAQDIRLSEKALPGPLQ